MSKKIKDFLTILPGSPIGATVVDGNVNHAIQSWKRRFKESNLIKDLYAGQEYVKPSTRRRKIVMNAKYLEQKRKGM